MSKEKYPYQRIFERDKFKCRYCGVNGSKDFSTWWYANFSIDHIVPKKHGGDDRDENLALSCHTCNLYKGGSKCDSFEEAKEIVLKKRAEAESWFNKHVKQS